MTVRRPEDNVPLTHSVSDPGHGRVLVVDGGIVALDTV